MSATVTIAPSGIDGIIGTVDTLGGSSIFREAAQPADPQQVAALQRFPPGLPIATVARNLPIVTIESVGWVESIATFVIGGPPKHATQPRAIRERDRWAAPLW
ncbi:MAG: hypothetical protein WD066_09010 [Planctomycetaceae bacterium]